MSAILESVLDEVRRAECRANDGAMAMGRPIIASQHRPARAAHQQPDHHAAPARSERSPASLVTTDELW